MEYWKIELWETENGVCRVDKDLLKQLRKKEKFLYKSLMQKMIEYVQKPIKNIQLSGDLEKIEERMWELKFYLPNKTQIRFLGCNVKKGDTHIFYALYAFKKKDQEVKDKHKNTTRDRIKEFLNQYNQNGLQTIL
jgi:phage-related protein